MAKPTPNAILIQKIKQIREQNLLPKNWTITIAEELNKKERDKEITPDLVVRVANGRSFNLEIITAIIAYANNNSVQFLIREADKLLKKAKNSVSVTLLLLLFSISAFGQAKADANQFKKSTQDNVARYFPDLATEFEQFKSNGYYPAEWARQFSDGNYLKQFSERTIYNGVICNGSENSENKASYNLQTCETYWKAMTATEIKPLMPPSNPVKVYHFFTDNRGKIWTNGSSKTRCLGLGFFPVKDFAEAINYFSLVAHPHGMYLVHATEGKNGMDVAVRNLGKMN